MWSSKCPVCTKPRKYKTELGWKRGKVKPCRSCANSISAGGVGDVQPRNGKKFCIKCRFWKRLNNFYCNSAGKWRSHCNKCNRQYVKENFRRYRYGLTQETFDKMVEDQHNLCFICNTETNLCVDHDHITNTVRRLLCRRCNAVLGLVNENIEVLQKMKEYLESFNGISSKSSQ